MSFKLKPQRIEKKIFLFKEHIQDFLYKNIVDKILALIIDEYKNIKTYLKNQIIEYYEKIDSFNIHEHHKYKDYINTKVYFWLTHYTNQYYNDVIKHEKIVTLWDLIGLFIECGSLFINSSVADISALYCDFSVYDPNIKIELIEPIPTFIKFKSDKKDFFITIEKTMDKKNASDITIQFIILPVGKQDSIFCQIIKKILNNLFLRFIEIFSNIDMLFNNSKYFLIKKHKLFNEVDDGHIFLRIYLNKVLVD